MSNFQGKCKHLCSQCFWEMAWMLVKKFKHYSTSAILLENHKIDSIQEYYLPK